MKSKKPIAIAAISLLIMIILGTGIGIWRHFYMQPEKVFGRRINAENYEAAGEIYSDSNRTDRRVMREYLLEVSNEYYEAYRSGKAGYEETREKLNEIRNMEIDEISEEINTVINKVEAIFYSNSCFEKGEEKFAEKNYETAYRYYCYVIEEDYHYQEALEKAGAAKELYIEQILEETQGLKENGKYQEAIERITAVQDQIGEADEL